jgi:hypothetical protein
MSWLLCKPVVCNGSGYGRVPAVVWYGRVWYGRVPAVDARPACVVLQRLGWLSEDSAGHVRPALTLCEVYTCGMHPCCMAQAASAAHG